LTLIEILIVIAVMALMVGMIMVGFGTSRQAEVMRAVNQIANASRYGYDKARVNGRYYRLLIDLEKGTFTLQEGDDKMYLPATDRDGKIIEFDESKAEDQAERDRRAADAYNRSLQGQIRGQAGGDTDGGGDEEDFDIYRPAPKAVPRRKPPMFDGFEEDNAISGLKEPIELPEGIKIVYVRTADDLKPITEGEASIYFFPRGRTQQANIQIEDRDTDAKWTIKVAPLTGRVTVEEGHEDLTLPDDPNDEEDELGKRRERRTF
jgi:general secretion pathway protein H